MYQKALIKESDDLLKGILYWILSILTNSKTKVMQKGPCPITNVTLALRKGMPVLILCCFYH